MKIKWLLLCSLVFSVKHLQANSLVVNLNSSKPTQSVNTLKEKTITGQITDEKGEGLPGASVAVKGTSIGTNTDAKGNFTLKVDDSKEVVLVVTYVGFTTQETTVGGRSVVNVQLKADTKSLDEVVVVGYGTQKRSDITGSVASVPKSRLSQLPVTNVMQAVQGSVAGVNVSQSSSIPGSSFRNV